VLAIMPHGPTNQEAGSFLVPFEQAVNSAEARARIAWFTLISLSAYVLIAFLATSHEDLLLENRQKLPILQVELPLNAFASIGPGILLLVHIAALVSVLYVRNALGDYCVALASVGSRRARTASTRRIAAGIFTRGPGLPDPVLLRSAQWTLETVTLWLAPPLIILLCQLRFMPYHDLGITWLHRVMLSLDLICAGIAVMAASRYLYRDTLSTHRRTITSRLNILGIVGLYLVIAFLSFLALQHRQDEWWNPLPRCAQHPCPVTFLFESERFPSLHRDLFAPDIQAVRQSAESLADMSFSVSFRGRDLEGAYLEGGRFYKADFRGANLRRANLRDADLRQALLGCVRHGRTGACTDDTNLQFADLSHASMQGADFSEVRAQGASFSSWERGGVKLQGADFNFAQLAGAVFYGDLTAANFYMANLAGARLSGDFAGADFDSAYLTYVDVTDKTNFVGASFDAATLDGASLSKANLWRVIGTPSFSNSPPILDCRGAKADRLSPTQYRKFHNEIRQLDSNVDDQDDSYSYLDPSNARPRVSDAEPIADIPTWLDHCRQYMPSIQGPQLARQYAKLICRSDVADSDANADINGAAMWPRYDWTGRFDSHDPENQLLIKEFYRTMFSDDGCARFFARVRTMDAAMLPDRFFSMIAQTARLADISEDLIAKKLGPCDDCVRTKN
jgi:uncharacterized protein YjbI with pentapeptide repeats